MKLFYLILLIVGLSACSQESVTTKNVEKAEPEHIEEKQVNTEDSTNTTETPKEEVTAIQEPEKLYKLNEANWTIEPIKEGNRKVVLLTIDDAPDKNGLEMAKILHSLGVHAIFFVNGHFIDSEEEKQTLKQIHDLGFLIGNHTYSHSNLSELTPDQQKVEILNLNQEIEKIIGEKPAFFRAPFGVNTDISKQLVKQEKMLLMNWTYGYDWEKNYQNSKGLAHIMVNSPYLTDGANLLMHDRPWTKDALVDIVKGLQVKGYEIVDPILIETGVQ
ncbi:polysaccharide deacetylase family protein [Peribacillus alkalitolerans]|uniref:polysaccharide deacetylase family protein n=1 Tax=Peribacillus alkalitolerans TaxID=1550385 RepID=UPI001F079BF5|nr:polysaccharide deacetylase family protein [Peribacillus alkalitolerans]